jgi:hypothetical protein
VRLTEGIRAKSVLVPLLVAAAGLAVIGATVPKDSTEGSDLVVLLSLVALLICVLVLGLWLLSRDRERVGTMQVGEAEAPLVTGQRLAYAGAVIAVSFAIQLPAEACETAKPTPPGSGHRDETATDTPTPPAAEMAEDS